VQNIPSITWHGTDKDIEDLGPFHIVIALEAEEREMRDHLIRLLTQHRVTDIQLIPAMRGVPLYGSEISHFFSHEVLILTLQNQLTRPSLRLFKRVFDIVGASVLLVLTFPLMAYIACQIWREDGGPVFFKQDRIGQGGRKFAFYKFRSMINQAESTLKHWEAANSPEWQTYCANNFKLSCDPRLLKFGALIRRTSVDELPQLYNVLKGDMSLVGPRPLLPRELPDYGDDISLYQLTNPGLTGLWQVSGRSNTTFADRIAFDVWYVKNWTLWIDIAILFKTISVVTQRKDAY
jgi:undecaprenyl-phosphate galactose phosphotransferase